MADLETAKGNELEISFLIHFWLFLTIFSPKMNIFELLKGCALIRQESRDRKYSTSMQENSDNSGKMSDFKKACRVVEAFLLNDTQLTGIRNLLDYNMRKGLCQEGSRDAKGTKIISNATKVALAHNFWTRRKVDTTAKNNYII